MTSRPLIAAVITALALALAAFLGFDLKSLTGEGASWSKEVTHEPTGGGTLNPAIDHFVLALSWSPSYCEAEGGGRDALQCGSGRPYAFIVHGLWPQGPDGREETLSDCDPSGRVPRAVIDGLLDIMPAPGLIGHQWRKHGSCTGLSIDAYFALVRQAYAVITVPEGFTRLTNARTLSPTAIADAFRASNPDVLPTGIDVTCNDHRLAEVRICLDRTLRPVTCAGRNRLSCRRPEVVMPPVRGLSPN